MPTTPTFATTEEQDLLRATVRDLATGRAGSERVREIMMTPDGVDEDLWKELAGLGLAGLTVPEDEGGAGAGFLELAIVLEELGRRLAPVPLLSSSALATTAVLAGADGEQRAALLPAVAAGTTRLALAHLDTAGAVDAPPAVQATPDGDGWVLDGTAGYVIDGHTADVVITAATTAEGLVLFAVPADTDGLGREPVEVLDRTRPLTTLTYTGVRVEADARLTGGDAAQALERALTVGAVLLASEQVGGAQQVLEMTTAYAKERVQFGRAIGSFQAVKHRLADHLVQTEAARSAAAHAARVLDADDPEELAVAAPLAASYCAEVYERVAADAIQLHGGIGFTWEHDVHLHLKRAKATKLLLGDPTRHRRRLGDALGL